jgi:hypothetical protein
MTIPNTVQQLGGRFCKAPMKLTDQADVSAHAVAPARWRSAPPSA